MNLTMMNKRISITTLAGMSASLFMAGCWAADAAVAQSGQGTSYADGVYSATGQYGGAPSSITVTVTLADGVIRAVRVTPHATNPTSLDFQRRFAAAVPRVVVGKPIDEVQVSRLAGSSGTPKGFNAAIQQIKERASSAPPAR